MNIALSIELPEGTSSTMQPVVRLEIMKPEELARYIQPSLQTSKVNSGRSEVSGQTEDDSTQLVKNLTESIVVISDDDNVTSPPPVQSQPPVESSPEETPVRAQQLQRTNRTLRSFRTSGILTE